MPFKGFFLSEKTSSVHIEIETFIFPLTAVAYNTNLAKVILHLHIIGKSRTLSQGSLHFDQTINSAQAFELTVDQDNGQYPWR